MPTVNETYWGKPFTYYGTFNLRTGANDLTDPDYTDFPPFVLNDFRYEQSVSPDYSRATLRQAQNESSPQHAYWTPNSPYPDLSIAYCGIKNRNLPQCNVRGYGTFPQSAANDYSDLENNFCFKTNPDDIKPVMFVSNYRYQMYKADYNLYPNLDANYFYNPYAIVSSQYYNGKYMWSPNTRDDPNNAPQRNTSYDTAYYRSIGIRTIFGVIMVQYYDVETELHATRKIPTDSHIVSLYNYKNQTDEWKATKKIVRIFLEIYRRKTTSGEYVNANAESTIKDSIVIDSMYGLKANTDVITTLAENEVDILAPCYSYTSGSTNANFPLFGLRSNSSRGTHEIGSNASGGMSNGSYAIIYGADRGAFKHGESSAQYLRTVWREIDGDADLDEWYNAAAAYGLFFTDGVASDSGYADLFAAGHDTDRWYSDKMCLGVVDNEGYTDGTYTRGLLNATAPNWGWKTTDQSPYNPALPPVPTNNYDTSTTFATIGDLATLTKQYILSGTFVKLLGEQLYNCIVDLTDNDTDVTELSNKIKSEFLVNDPIDCIVSLRRFPTQPPIKQQGDDNLVHLLLGRYDTLLSVYELAHPTGTYTFTLSTPIYPVFGDSFADYEPYVNMELYIPFCGTVQLHPQDILGRNLSVKLIMDYTTGTATAFVLSDSLVIETITGTLGVDIPVSGIQGYTAASQLQNAIINRKSAVASEIQQGFNIINNITNPVGYFTNLYQSNLQRQQADYDLQHVNAPVHVVGASSPITSWAIDPTKCRLLIYYPTGEIIDNSNQQPKFIADKLTKFGANQGFATVENNTIGSYSGLVIASNPLTGSMTTASGKALTNAEIELIISALSEGVIV